MKKLYTSCSQQVNSSWRKKEKGEKAMKRMEEQVNTATASLNRCVEEKQSVANDLTEMRVKYNLLSDEYASLEKQVHDLPAVDAEVSVGAKEHNDFANRIRQEKMRQDELELEEAEEANNGPKDVALFCASSPQVRITDLDREYVDKNICLQLQIGSPELQTRLLLYCDGNVNVN
ncbi:hypothetical protein AV274_3733 [Blastocystis sp. ATCC 50177/Nand II]|uniref:Uncharacterized protein n=1 Tax=Blastocystis sp. subtype 1 (strain ATCC 50177 / NandII) TaxID=478820 RepID=A0A196SE21_BLAHN|nr:hypothetical protein AV274_3733 [Blastocystis sp. ATCC 50177/Nand II]